jgi:RNA polymerase sigma factor (sigma-70 family)
MTAEADSFENLIHKVRAGNHEAAAELVRRYEPAIRRTIRLRLDHAGLDSLLDSMDICQSVLGNFFVRAAAGEFDLDNAEQLLKLLTRMARNKLISAGRKHRAARRDVRRVHSVSAEKHDLVADDACPSDQVACQELFREAYRRLTDEERRLVELRSHGLAWGDIAGQLLSSPAVLRKQLSRALDRVSRELGMEAGAGE